MRTPSSADLERSWIGGLIDWYDRHRGISAIVFTWLITRVLSLLLAATVERFVVGDVRYYHGKLRALLDLGLGQTLNEYPTPVVWILLLPYGATGGSRVGYLVAFIIFMLILDAAFTYALYRSAGRRHGDAVDFWLIFVALIGPLSYLRFDILPAVLAGGALLAARRRPWITGALTGLGAAVKLWPALLILSFLAYRRDRKAAGLAFVLVGFGLAAVSLLTGGWSRLVSPLTWQSGRGLQIESIWATPLMVARAIRPRNWTVDKSAYQAYEIFGPGVYAWVQISNLVTVLGLAVIAVLVVRGYRAGGSTPVAVGFAVVATVAIMIVTNKTLSPQYLLWLGGPVAALFVLHRTARPEEQRAIIRVAGQLVALALLTHLVYPQLYDGFLGLRGRPMIIVSTVVTALRNVALVLFTVEVCRMAWRFLGADNRFDQGG
ncbi:MAG TPA: glycosyltransferase family 87 protein [Propionibacteriaceae bacterium]|nr:glycosyltransferase family 87 protein [Propionibacteriaceae bacterium]